MSKRSFYIIVIIGLCITFGLNFAAHHRSVPTDCDEFGYLYMAEAMSSGQTFKEHTPRPYLQQLTDTFEAKGIHPLEYSYMVAPLAYYLKPEVSKVINMYHPGTSWLMHFFPLSYRKYFFPVIAILLFAPLLFVISSGTKFSFGDIGVVVLVLLMFLPFSVLRTEFTRVNSLAFTFGILTLAGFFISKRPDISIILIILTGNFRLANILLIWPLVILFLWNILAEKRSLLTFTKNAFWLFLGSLAALLPYFFYTYFLLENPLMSTYADVDTRFAQSPVNLTFYTQLSSQWFLLHVIALAGLIVLNAKKQLPFKALLAVIALVFFNYAFYSFKQITMNYYIYASFFVMAGIILNSVSSIEVTAVLRQRFKYITAGILSMLLIASVVEFSRHDYPGFYTAAKPYRQQLSSYQIVWCDLLSGTTEYTNGNNGFMYNRATPRARKIAYQFFYENKISQVFILKDLPADSASIVHELNETALPFHIVNNSFLGPVIVIKNGI